MPTRYFTFTARPTAGDVAFLQFADPAPSAATQSADNGDFALEILAADANGVTGADKAHAFVKLRGVELAWSPTQAALRCDEGLESASVAEVVAFTHYERALRQIEAEISAAWTELDQDRPVAFEATPADLKRGSEIGERMSRTFSRRARLARLEPHLLGIDAHPSALARKLREELCEKTSTADRLEIADGHLEVFEHVYEMASQRLGEFRASHGEHKLEWIIILLLTVETLIMFLTRGSR